MKIEHAKIKEAINKKLAKTIAKNMNMNNADILKKAQDRVKHFKDKINSFFM